MRGETAAGGGKLVADGCWFSLVDLLVRAKLR